jgi:hypothetical protein
MDDSTLKAERLSDTFLPACGIKTYFMFGDLPVHYEILAGYYPFIPDDTVIDFDLSVLVSVQGKTTKIQVSGPRRLKRKLLKYNVRSGGMVQYCEWEVPT